MTDTALTPDFAVNGLPTPRVLLASTDPAVCSNVHTILQSGSLVDVVVETGGRDEVIKAAGDYCPDVIILSEALTADDPFGTARALRDQCADTHLVLLGTPKANDAQWNLAVRAAVGFVDSLNIPNAVGPADPAFDTTDAAARPVPGGAIRITVLTSREREVLQWVADGLSSKEIAGRLSISVRTVESHRNQIMNKLQLRSIAELTKYAVRHGLASL